MSGQLRVDGRRPAEQHEDLVDQMRPEVVQDSPAGLVRILLPGRRPGAGRLPPFEPRLDSPQLAEAARAHQRGHGAEVSVPTAIVVRDEQPAAFLGESGQLLDVRRGRGDRLVDDDGEPGAQRCLGHRHVGAVGHGHDGQVEVVRSAQQLVEIGHDPCIWIPLASGSLALRMRCHDGRQQQPGRGRDQRRVEDRSAQPVTDDCHPNRSLVHALIMVANGSG